MAKLNKTPKIVFFGNERLATGVSSNAPALQALIDAGYEVPVVVSNYEVGRSRNARKLEIADVAEKQGILLLLPDRPADIKEQLLSYGADVAILVAYGKIVPQEIIDIFPKGIINIHPSLLPLHRGPTPIESVILDGSTKTGVSLMQLIQEMDAGPVFGHSEIELSGKESKQELANTLLEIGSSMLIELLPGIIDGSIVARPQNSSEATYDSLLKKEKGLLDFTKPAITVEREIRAYHEWPKSYTSLNGIVMTIKSAAVVGLAGKPGEYKADKKSLIIYCGKDALEITSLQPAGKKEMPIQAFLAGYKL